jgi:hypothetical protein
MTAVLQSLSIDALEDLYYHDFPEAREEDKDEKKKKPKRSQIIDEISDKLDALAIDIFIASLPLAQLKILAEKAKVPFKKDDNKNSRSVLSRRLHEQVLAAGFDEFLSDTADAETLKAVAEDFDEDKADKKTIAETARALAAERYFSGFDLESLRALADDLKLKNAAKSSSKRKIVEAIVEHDDIQAPEPPKKKKKQTPKAVEVGKKKALEKGTTYEEIFQHYSVEELRGYAKQKGIKVYGNKPVLIKRILAYLEGNTEGIMAGEKPGKKKTTAKGKGKKASSDKKEKASEAKKATSKGKSKKAADKEENGNSDE